MFKLMDADASDYWVNQPNVISSVVRDPKSFISLSGLINTDRRTKEEFTKAVNQTLFALVLEDALSRDDPIEYVREGASGASFGDDLDKLFPTENSTVGEAEIR